MSYKLAIHEHTSDEDVEMTGSGPDVKSTADPQQGTRRAVVCAEPVGKVPAGTRDLATEVDDPASRHLRCRAPGESVGVARQDFGRSYAFTRPIPPQPSQIARPTVVQFVSVRRGPPRLGVDCSQLEDDGRRGAGAADGCQDFLAHLRNLRLMA